MRREATRLRAGLERALPSCRGFRAAYIAYSKGQRIGYLREPRRDLIAC